MVLEEVIVRILDLGLELLLQDVLLVVVVMENIWRYLLFQMMTQVKLVVYLDYILVVPMDQQHMV